MGFPTITMKPISLTADIMTIWAMTYILISPWMILWRIEIIKFLLKIIITSKTISIQEVITIMMMVTQVNCMNNMETCDQAEIKIKIGTEIYTDTIQLNLYKRNKVNTDKKICLTATLIHL